MPEMDIPRCLQKQKRAAARRTWLAQQMSDARITPHRLLFEDLYGPDGPAHLAALFDALGLPRDSPAYDAAVARMTASSGQNSAALYPLVPNIAETRAALQSGSPASPIAPLGGRV